MEHVCPVLPFRHAYITLHVEGFLCIFSRVSEDLGHESFLLSSSSRELGKSLDFIMAILINTLEAKCFLKEEITVFLCYPKNTPGSLTIYRKHSKKC